jgi:hypothetical protein
MAWISFGLQGAGRHDERVGGVMATHVVMCQACETENAEYEDRDGTYWFTCVNKNCEYDNEVVHSPWK